MERIHYTEVIGDAINEIDYLHFELCYYQAIEWAIKNNYQFVEGGAQGPHKIQRGYLPEKTYSSHYISYIILEML